MQNPNPLLAQLDNAGVRRSGRWLVRGITMSVSRGEIVTLIGPNGSGKSTTAKLALGVLECDEGKATLNRNTIISYVPQKLDLDWSLPLTVKRFLRLGAIGDEGDLDWAIETTGVSHLLDVQLSAVSGGEFQRVQIARAIARKPDLLVLDEPTQGVDFIGQGDLYGLVKRVRDELDCGVLLVSHDLHIVMAATDRVYCLNGHVCCSGPPKTVADSREFKELFGDALNPALAVYEHQHDHEHLPDGSVKQAQDHTSDYTRIHDKPRQGNKESVNANENSHA